MHWRSIIMDIWRDPEVMRVRVRLASKAQTFLGTYFYLYLPGSRFHSMPVMVLSSDHLSTGQTDLSFLIWGKRLELEKGQHISLDGPYGRDLKLHSFENVILTAEGIGIVGVLPLALRLAQRMQYDSEQTSGSPFRDLTRHVDLFWKLDHNGQEKWVAEQLQALQALDPYNVSPLGQLAKRILTWPRNSLLWSVSTRRRERKTIPLRLTYLNIGERYTQEEINSLSWTSYSRRLSPLGEQYLSVRMPSSLYFGIPLMINLE
jgi:hypothetical protein